jgi:nitrogen fixation protein FixH
MSSGGSTESGARRITGRMVLIALLGFFGFVTLVNIVMVHAAITTFGGVDTPSSYQAGLAFRAEVAEAEAQAARSWQVDVRIVPTADGTAVSLDVRDGDDHPVTGAEVIARLAHPIDERRDVTVPVTEMASGRYQGRADAEPGQWTLDIEIAKGGHRMFRSRNRIAIE